MHNNNFCGAQQFRVLDLFSGIGGFSLGLERAGMRTVAFCEIEPFPRAVLRKHWPDIPCYEDIRTLTAQRLAKDGIHAIDVICGGFPCQDISIAGRKIGIGGERSGLWSEIARLVCEIRPRFVIVENVAALIYNGLGTVLGDLAALGYDTEWHCIPASAVGAPHVRDRVWIIANPRHGFRGEIQSQRTYHESEEITPWHQEIKAGHLDILVRRVFNGSRENWWGSQSRMARSVNGLSSGMDRRRGLGNAVVPQIPEIIGRAIIAAHRSAP